MDRNGSLLGGVGRAVKRKGGIATRKNNGLHLVLAGKITGKKGESLPCFGKGAHE